MKPCPECLNSLLYCLDDGIALVHGSVTDEPPTAIISSEQASTDQPTQVLISSASTERVSSASWRSPLRWVVAAVFILVAAAFGYLYLNQPSRSHTSEAFHEFDVSQDGRRFLIGTLAGESTAKLPTVVLNWTALLKN